ncbi:MAG: hypothetical protein JWO38_3039 [Gemmataceae bacterium]|nr:hypothetical protein [Gemmataceae bacterium]
MTLAEFLAAPDSLVGKQVSVTGWLHSDSVRLWLADRPHCEDRQLAVRAPELARWFHWHIPPLVGSAWAYCFEAEVSGVVLPRNWEGIPVLGGEVDAVVQYSGGLYLRGGEPAAPPS